VVESYLLFRMRAAGYRGPNVFSAAATTLIGKASNGLMRRVNILADKSLLAAFVEDTHNIEVRHVQAAIRDSELSPRHTWNNRKTVVMAGGIALSAALLIAIGWLSGGAGKSADPAKLPTPVAITPITDIVPATPASAPATDTVVVAAVAAIPVIPVAAPASSAVIAASPQADPAVPHTSPTASQKSAPPAQVATATVGKNKSGPPPTLLQQRLTATQEVLAKRDGNNASIQLFYTEDTQPARMERFLMRANNLGKLSEIYVLPIKVNGKKGFRVLYGAYPDIKAASTGMQQLPKRYKEAFTPVPYLLDGTQIAAD